MGDRFANLTRIVSSAAGSWQASVAAFLLIAAWVIGGFYFGFTSTLYQLLINSATTVVTFLMVFLIQGAQNRDSQSVQLKLSEIICALERADNRLIGLEKGTDEDIDQVRKALDAQKDKVDRKEN